MEQMANNIATFISGKDMSRPWWRKRIDMIDGDNEKMAKLKFDDIDFVMYCSKCGRVPNPDDEDISEKDFMEICQGCGAKFDKPSKI